MKACGIWSWRLVKLFWTDFWLTDSLILQNTYLTLVRSSKSTSVHTLPALNLMKNSASELFCLDHAAAYQHAFTYVRQLAIHLRNSMKVKTKVKFYQILCLNYWWDVRQGIIQAGVQLAIRPQRGPVVFGPGSGLLRIRRSGDWKRERTQAHYLPSRASFIGCHTVKKLFWHMSTFADTNQ
jgi:hypothetical protein